MKPIDSTAEVLAYKVLNRLTDKIWIDWAYNMLLAGIETESLLILAGMEEPLDYFEMRSLTEKVFDELGLAHSNKNEILKLYASYLIKQNLDGKIKSSLVLSNFKDIYIELDYYPPLSDFYDFYFAWKDLQYDTVQWYIDGVDRANIDQVIDEYFREWISKNPIVW